MQKLLEKNKNNFLIEIGKKLTKNFKLNMGSLWELYFAKNSIQNLKNHYLYKNKEKDSIHRIGK